MASQKQINYLISDYGSVARHLKEAAEILIDTEKVASDVLGRVGPNAPPALISVLSDLIGSLFLARSELAKATPTDKEATR